MRGRDRLATSWQELTSEEKVVFVSVACRDSVREVHRMKLIYVYY